MVTTAAERFAFAKPGGNRTHDPAAKGEWAANASGMSRPCAAGTPPGGKPGRGEPPRRSRWGGGESIPLAR